MFRFPRVKNWPKRKGDKKQNVDTATFTVHCCLINTDCFFPPSLCLIWKISQKMSHRGIIAPPCHRLPPWDLNIVPSLLCTCILHCILCYCPFLDITPLPPCKPCLHLNWQCERVTIPAVRYPSVHCGLPASRVRSRAHRLKSGEKTRDMCVSGCWRRASPGEKRQKGRV